MRADGRLIRIAGWWEPQLQHENSPSPDTAALFACHAFLAPVQVLPSSQQPLACAAVMLSRPSSQRSSPAHATAAEAAAAVATVIDMGIQIMTIAAAAVATQTHQLQRWAMPWPLPVADEHARISPEPEPCCSTGCPSDVVLQVNPCDDCLWKPLTRRVQQHCEGLQLLRPGPRLQVSDKLYRPGTAGMHVQLARTRRQHSSTRQHRPAAVLTCQVQQHCEGLELLGPGPGR